MKIIRDILWGAATQFGREFGRAGANQILKGKNHYVIKGQSDYSGRIKPSDSDIVRAYKEINRIKFAQSNKANVSRLIDITDKVFTTRNAKAEGKIFVNNNVLNAIKENTISKGNVLTVAKVSAIQAAKKVAELIPMCHQINLTFVDINFSR